MLRGDIVIVELPAPPGGQGHEQAGQRPALIVHNDVTSAVLRTIAIAPFTSNLNRLNLPHTILVRPSPENGLEQPSVLLVLQLVSIDRRRIGRIIGRLEAELIAKVDAELRYLLGL